MKNLFFALIALLFVLGTGCKKSEAEAPATAKLSHKVVGSVMSKVEPHHCVYICKCTMCSKARGGDMGPVCMYD